MKFKVLFISSVSACFEMDNLSPYYAGESYDVYVNEEKTLENITTNVFSLYDLKPDTGYTVRVGEDSVSFTTNKESACIDVKDFGAKGDGINDDTEAIQQAINVCPKDGRVVINEGTYLIRPVQLKSRMTLDLKEGAVLLGDTKEEDYPVLPGEIDDPNTNEKVQISSFEGTPMPCHKSLISAYYVRDLIITGKGIINGNADKSTWWENVKTRKIGRPRLMFLSNCKKVTVHGITGMNSASWNFHPFFSKDISFLDMQVKAPSNSPNTDGTDPESCDGVNYIGVRFSVGDDAIAIKSGKMYMGMKYKTPAKNHLIRNCLMEYAHGAVVLGSEMSGGIKDLTVSQCLFVHTDRGLRIKTRRNRGKYAVVDGVEFSNIRMENVKAPLVINMFYNCDAFENREYLQSREPQKVDDTTPYLGKFTFKDMVCEDCEWAAGYFYGLPEQPIGEVKIENIEFSFKEDALEGKPAMMDDAEVLRKAGLVFHNVKKVELKNVKMTGQNGEEVVKEGVLDYESD